MILAEAAAGSLQAEDQVSSLGKQCREVPFSQSSRTMADNAQKPNKKPYLGFEPVVRNLGRKGASIARSSRQAASPVMASPPDAQQA